MRMCLCLGQLRTLPNLGIASLSCHVNGYIHTLLGYFAFTLPYLAVRRAHTDPDSRRYLTVVRLLFPSDPNRSRLAHASCPAPTCIITICFALSDACFRLLLRENISTANCDNVGVEAVEVELRNGCRRHYL